MRLMDFIAHPPALAVDLGRSAGPIVRSDHDALVDEETRMTIASDLVQRHVQTLVADNAQWQTLIADDLVWELVYAPSIGHPARLSGREDWASSSFAG